MIGGLGFLELFVVLLIIPVMFGVPIITLVGVFLIYRKVTHIEEELKQHS